MEITAGTLITQQELLKLAKLSCIKLDAQEVEPLRENIEAILSYAGRLNDIAAATPHVDAAVSPQSGLVNVFRQDRATLGTDSMVACAQAHENNYFVVPVIIKHS